MQPRLAPLSAEFNRVFVACSGGLDSTVLLHLVVEAGLDAEVVPWHVNHGLTGAAAEMQRFCVEQCRALGLELRVDRLDGAAIERNVEAEARRQRYRLFERHTGAGDAVLTAHHADDQAETFLLNALRGAGSGGLRGIARRRPLGEAWLLRPLLDCSRAELEAWARARGLSWFDDPSNRDLRFDRNYLRHAVMPLLRERWPHCVEALSTCCDIQAETRQLLDQLAAEDCRAAADDTGALRLAALAGLERARVVNLLRFWLARAGVAPPPQTRLDELLRQFAARADAAPSVDMPDYSLRIYDRRLFIVRDAPAGPAEEELELGDLERIDISRRGLHTTRREVFDRCGVSDRGQPLLLRFAADGRAPGDRHRLKRLFQKHRVPPWRRAATAQVYIGERLSGLLP